MFDVIFQNIVYLTKFIPYTKFWIFRKIIRPLLREPILDLGCAKGDTFWCMKFSGNIIGVDIFLPYLEIAKRRGIYKKLIVGDVEEILIRYLNVRRFETIVAFDFLEHLPKQKAIKILEMMEKLGKNVVISMPYGTIVQDGYDGNIYQRHVTFFEPQFFSDIGYRIIPFWLLTIKRFIQNRKKPLLKEFIAVALNKSSKYQTIEDS